MKSAIGFLLWSAIALAALLGIAGNAAWWNVWVFLSFMGVTAAATTSWRTLLNYAARLCPESMTLITARAMLTLDWGFCPVIRLPSCSI